MLAIIGGSKEQIKNICDNGDILVVANYNSPNQVVLSGDTNSVKQAIDYCKKIGFWKRGKSSQYFRAY